SLKKSGFAFNVNGRKRNGGKKRGESGPIGSNGKESDFANERDSSSCRDCIKPSQKRRSSSERCGDRCATANRVSDWGRKPCDSYASCAGALRTLWKRRCRKRPARIPYRGARGCRTAGPLPTSLGNRAI